MYMSDPSLYMVFILYSCIFSKMYCSLCDSSVFLEYGHEGLVVCNDL